MPRGRRRRSRRRRAPRCTPTLPGRPPRGRGRGPRPGAMIVCRAWLRPVLEERPQRCRRGDRACRAAEQSHLAGPVAAQAGARGPVASSPECREAWSATASACLENGRAPMSESPHLRAAGAVRRRSRAGSPSLSNRLTERIRVPAPVLFLVGRRGARCGASRPARAAGAHGRAAGHRRAGGCILFDGGMHIGWRPVPGGGRPDRSSSASLGTFLTVAGGGRCSCTSRSGWTGTSPLLVATAVAPTDPAVVFSVLGQREVAGRSGTILEGESGANDPVGIALMASLLAAGGLGAGACLARRRRVRPADGRRRRGRRRRRARAAAGSCAGCRCPARALYPLRTLACALLLFGLATVAHGSGFLAVFVAGIVIGDERGALQARDRALPLGAGQPRRDRRVRRARA